jgi:NAD(P)H-hydrate epimerase
MTWPSLTREQARLLDRWAVERCGMCSLILMENAGRGVADVLCGLGIGGPVVVCCGKGNNGGDGLVLARHLELRGHEVRVLLWADPAAITGDAAANLAIVRHCDVMLDVFWPDHDPARLASHLNGAAWVVDALLGTGARGEPTSPLAEVIDQLNACAAPRLAIDLPSGLDADTGQPAGHTIRAAHTCTFVAPKAGFKAPQAQPYLGQVHVLDIGTPRRLLKEVLQASV